MAADRSYISVNDRERHRLETLVDKLDDAALSRPMPAGWTVAGVLGHLAFWDQRIVALIELLASVAARRGGSASWVGFAASLIQSTSIGFSVGTVAPRFCSRGRPRSGKPVGRVARKEHSAWQPHQPAARRASPRAPRRDRAGAGAGVSARHRAISRAARRAPRHADASHTRRATVPSPGLDLRGKV
jgi:hypothetical protein